MAKFLNSVFTILGVWIIVDLITDIIAKKVKDKSKS